MDLIYFERGMATYLLLFYARINGVWTGQVRQCEACGKKFLVRRLKDGLEQKLIDKEEYNKLNKTKKYPDLSSELPYTCEACKGIVPESVPGNQESCRKPAVSTHHEDAPENEKSSTGNDSSFNFYALGILTVVIGILLSTLAFYTNHEESLKETPFDVNIQPLSFREMILEEDIDKLEGTYTRQEERVWYTLLAGIKSVLRENPNQPSVFLMLYDSDSAGTTARCIARDVVRAASRFLMGRQKEAPVFSGIDLEREDFMEDPGTLLVHLNQTVRQSGSLLVTELQHVPPRVAKSFHFICDKYSPLVETAVLFFTLNVDYVGAKLQRDAEARLNELWARDMEDSFLNPLITRMTPNILKIKSDNSC